MILNSIVDYFNCNGNNQVYGIDECYDLISNKINTSKLNDLINFTIIDPTSGTGAFLLKAIEIKIKIVEKIKSKLSIDDLHNIVKSIYGNDIDEYSIFVLKLRMLLFVLFNRSREDVNHILYDIDSNFYNYDFIKDYSKITNKFDLVLGNPPYVEKSRYEDKSIVKYGNIYADVVENSYSILADKGMLSMIIPMSYISTGRMSGIRKFISNSSDYSYILSFADRPDCLFAGVHQKLNVLIAKKGKESHKVYTSDYYHWYKKERSSIYNKIKVVENNFIEELFVPKLVNDLEVSIYKKIKSNSNSLLSYNGSKGNPVYLNMRGTFWIKSFLEEPYNSKEYKKFYFEENTHLLNCLLNSSLFWWFWMKVSDGWHITNKELLEFKVPSKFKSSLDKFEELSKQLDIALEDRKEKINSKQAMYEYKHKLCKAEIDMIDDCLSKEYGLTKKELDYIKQYHQRYRMGLGVDD